jgi:hypothetical protein
MRPVPDRGELRGGNEVVSSQWTVDGRQETAGRARQRDRWDAQQPVSGPVVYWLVFTVYRAENLATAGHSRYHHQLLQDPAGSIPGKTGSTPQVFRSVKDSA